MQKAVKLHYRHLHLLNLLIMKIQGIPKIQTRIRILKQEIQTQEMMMAMEEMAAIAVGRRCTRINLMLRPRIIIVNVIVWCNLGFLLMSVSYSILFNLHLLNRSISFSNSSNIEIQNPIMVEYN